MILSNKVLLKICQATFREKTYFTLCCINLTLLVIVIGSPLMLWHHYEDAQYLMLGWWTICDQLGCDAIFVINGYMEATQILSILAVLMSLIAVVSSRDLLSHLATVQICEALISSLANFSTGIILVCSLVITDMKLRTEVDTDGTRLTPFCGFFLACFVCILCFLLGTQSLLRHLGFTSAEERLCVEISPEKSTHHHTELQL
ncbi:Hypothetical predicted protein [Podarcis lilfordi]|uniref:Uncharacterized protein n=1 Tax=Podarcis lilfordi TaxID=74358 RepID=A0AA35KPH6_9SAUR|nr:Hypothetical predicted protein [Podarcis lilfordi]